MQLRNLIIGILLMLLGFGAINRCTTIENFEQLTEAKESVLVRYKNKVTNTNSASRQVMILKDREIEKLRAGAYEDSVTIAQLQAAVKAKPKGTRSVTVADRKITVKATGKTIVFSADTALANVSNTSGSVKGQVTITPDTAIVDLTVQDQLTFYQTEERYKFFGPKIPTVHINNTNQDVEITGLRSVEVKPSGLKIGKGWIFAGGFLFGAGTIVYLSR